jgi:hypothetical protein
MVPARAWFWTPPATCTAPPYTGGSNTCGCGVVYKLSPTASGPWQYTVLHRFVGTDGAQPDANLVID